LYYRTVAITQGLLIWKAILQPSAGASSFSSPGATPDRDSLEDYPVIEGNACWNPAIKTCHINMVGPARGDSQNNSSQYPTIGGSKASDARTPSSNIIWNLNPDFNIIRL
jgi:hypothetical protein